MEKNVPVALHFVQGVHPFLKQLLAYCHIFLHGEKCACCASFRPGSSPFPQAASCLLSHFSPWRKMCLLRFISSREFTLSSSSFLLTVTIFSMVSKVFFITSKVAILATWSLWRKDL